MKSDSEMFERLRNSIMWINLRVKLATLLREQIDKGDRVASEQLNFLTKHWPTGSAPLAAERHLLEHTASRIGKLLVRALDALQVLGYRTTDITAQAIHEGVDVPQHLRSDVDV